MIGTQPEKTTFFETNEWYLCMRCRADGHLPLSRAVFPVLKF